MTNTEHTISGKYSPISTQLADRRHLFHLVTSSKRNLKLRTSHFRNIKHGRYCITQAHSEQRVDLFLVLGFSDGLIVAFLGLIDLALCLLQFSFTHSLRVLQLIFKISNSSRRLLLGFQCVLQHCFLLHCHSTMHISDQRLLGRYIRGESGEWAAKASSALKSISSFLLFPTGTASSPRV